MYLHPPHDWYIPSKPTSDMGQQSPAHLTHSSSMCYSVAQGRCKVVGLGRATSSVSPPCSRSNDRQTRNYLVVRGSPTPSLVSCLRDLSTSAPDPPLHHRSLPFFHPRASTFRRWIRTDWGGHGDGTGSTGRHSIVQYRRPAR